MQFTAGMANRAIARGRWDMAITLFAGALIITSVACGDDEPPVGSAEADGVRTVPNGAVTGSGSGSGTGSSTGTQTTGGGTTGDGTGGGTTAGTTTGATTGTTAGTTG